MKDLANNLFQKLSNTQTEFQNNFEIKQDFKKTVKASFAQKTERALKRDSR